MWTLFVICLCKLFKITMSEKIKQRQSSKDNHSSKNEKESWTCEICKKVFSVQRVTC